VGAFEVGKLAHPALLDQEAPGAYMTAPETADAALQALGTPVALLDVLEAGELVHQPARQALGVRRQVEGLPGGGHAQAALQAQEAAEERQAVAASSWFSPARVRATSMYWSGVPFSSMKKAALLWVLQSIPRYTCIQTSFRSDDGGPRNGSFGCSCYGAHGAIHF
jgi:hypothetical protein